MEGADRRRRGRAADERRDDRNVSGGAARQAASRCSAATRSGRSASGSCRRPAARAKYIYPSLAQFPIDAEVVPQLVLTKAADGTEIHNQLFLPKDLKPGEKRPAIVFVHGGPVRQMLLGYHYMHFYHVAYAVNQWLASRGYVVMSINYRSGIGYGKSFRTAPNTGGRGNAEYQDVLAGGKYLQTRAGRRCEPRRHLGTVVRRRAHRAGAGAQLRHLQGRRRSRRRAPVGQLARSGERLVHSRRRSRRSTRGSRRCCSSRETTTATCSSRR